MKVFANREIDSKTIEEIKFNCGGDYTPRITFPSNRTVINYENRYVVQLDINHNLCEVIVNGNVEIFKKVMLSYIIEMMIETVKKNLSPRVANEIGFKFFFYVPEGSVACNEQWWNFENRATFYKMNKTETETVFSTPLKNPHVRLVLLVHLTDNYSLTSLPFGYFGNSGNSNQQQNNVFGNIVNPQNNGFGNTPQNNGFGNTVNPQQNNGFGNTVNPQQNNGFGNTVNPQQNNGFGNTVNPQQNGFGNTVNPQQNNGFGNTVNPQQNNTVNPQQNNGFGNTVNPQQNNGFGNTVNPQQNNGFGNTQQNSGFDNFNVPTNSGFGNLASTTNSGFGNLASTTNSGFNAPTSATGFGNLASTTNSGFGSFNAPSTPQTFASFNAPSLANVTTPASFNFGF
jgi:hypothetical protein